MSQNIARMRSPIPFKRSDPTQRSERLFYWRRIWLNLKAIASLDLAVNEAFGYWFNFGDDWWHQVDVVDIVEQALTGKYPKVRNRVGASPPQYADFDWIIESA